MKKLALAFVLLSLTSCGLTVFKTPQERYFALTNMVTATGKVAVSYVDNCKAQLKTDPCHTKLPKINSAAVTANNALQQADKVFATQDSAYYDLSLTAVENALAGLQTLLKD